MHFIVLFFFFCEEAKVLDAFGWKVFKDKFVLQIKYI